MKIICCNKVVDLSKFESVRCRESLLGSSYGYPVEAVRYQASGGIFGGTTTISEEIVRFAYREYAEQLVKDITNAWIEGNVSFDLLKWDIPIEENTNEV